MACTGIKQALIMALDWKANGKLTRRYGAQRNAVLVQRHVRWR